MIVCIHGYFVDCHFTLLLFVLYVDVHFLISLHTLVVTNIERLQYVFYVDVHTLLPTQHLAVIRNTLHRVTKVV